MSIQIFNPHINNITFGFTTVDVLPTENINHYAIYRIINSQNEETFYRWLNGSWKILNPGGNGNDIVEVDELPSDGIDETKFYKCIRELPELFQGYCCYPGQGAMTLEEAAYQQGAPQDLRFVYHVTDDIELLQEEEIVPLVDGWDYHLYFNLATTSLFFFDSGMWFDAMEELFNLYPEENLGIISSIDDLPADWYCYGFVKQEAGTEEIVGVPNLEDKKVIYEYIEGSGWEKCDSGELLMEKVGNFPTAADDRKVYCIKKDAGKSEVVVWYWEWTIPFSTLLTYINDLEHSVDYYLVDELPENPNITTLINTNEEFKAFYHIYILRNTGEPMISTDGVTWKLVGEDTTICSIGSWGGVANDQSQMVYGPYYTKLVDGFDSFYYYGFTNEHNNKFICIQDSSGYWVDPLADLSYELRQAQSQVNTLNNSLAQVTAKYDIANHYLDTGVKNFFNFSTIQIETDGKITAKRISDADNASLTTLTIPKGVTKVADGYLNDPAKLTTLTIGNTVESLGKSAFYYCWKTTSVNFESNSNLKEIGEYCFYCMDKLSKITLPPTVEKIGKYAFSGIGDSSFQSYGATVSFGNNNVLKTIEEYTFYDVCMYNMVIPDSVTTIETSGFNGYFSSFTFGENSQLTAVKERGLSIRGATSLTLPKTLIDIHPRALDGTYNLTTLAVQTGNPKYHSQGNCVIDTAEKILFAGCQSSIIPSDGSVTKIGERAFYDQRYLKDINIPATITEIGEDAFYSFGSNAYSYSIPTYVRTPDLAAWCNIDFSNITSNPFGALSYHKIDFIVNGENLTTFSAPEGITRLKPYVFYNSPFTSADLTGITEINDYAMAYCGSLTSVIFDDGLKNIGNGGFYSCKVLPEINLPEGLETIGDSAFCGCNQLTTLTIPSSVISVGKEAFKTCNGFTELEFTHGIEFGDGCFYGCTGLTTLKIAGGTTIGKECFYKCSGLTDVWFSGPVSVKTSAFFNCSNLTNLYVSSLEDWMMSDFESGISASNIYFNNETLTSLLVPQQCTRIPSYSFANSNMIEEVVCHEGVESIGERAFYSADNLTRVELANVKEIESNAFYYCSGLSQINLEKVERIGDYAFAYTGIAEVEFNKDAEIQESAFTGCDSLTEVTLPENLTVTEYGIFQYCDNLRKIVFNKKLVEIGQQSFYSCPALEELDFSQTESVPTIHSVGISRLSADCKVYVPDALYEQWLEQKPEWESNFVKASERTD